ncbi:MAG: ABC transporter permease [Desulfomonilaceae bacterium]
MTFSDLIVISSRQIYRMRRRYRGPLIGATLGVAALITVVTLGDLVEKSIGSNLSILGGATIIKVNILLDKTDNVEDPRKFTDEDMKVLKRLPGVEVVASSVYSWWPTGLVFDAHYKGIEYERVRVMGIDPAFFDMTSFLPMGQGRRFTDDDVKQVRNVCIIGRDLRKWFFEKNESPLGKTILVAGIYCEIVGVLGKPDNWQFDETVFLPISTARAKIKGLESVRRLSVLPTDVYCVDDVRSEIMSTIKARKSSYPYEVTYDRERVDIILTILNIFTMFVYVAVAATLILSGVGIANVMLATVRERTSEIGLRKAVGATNVDVAIQFVAESILISVISSVLGSVLGTVIVVVFSLLALHGELNIHMYLMAVVGAIVTCAISGLAAGWAPARKAARLDPIVALRAE